MWTLKKALLPLLCAGMLFSTQIATAFAQSSGVLAAEALSDNQEAYKEDAASEKAEAPDETLSPAETDLIEETVSWEETDPPEETVSREETDPPEETVSPDGTGSSEETVSPDETDPSEETVSPDETGPPEETASPEDAGTSEETPPPDETDPSKETSSPEDTDPSEEPASSAETPPSEETIAPEVTNPEGENLMPEAPAVSDDTAPGKDAGKKELLEAELPQEELLKEKLISEDKLFLADDIEINYGIELAWQNPEFEYGPLWNPDTHSYDSWGAPDNLIIINSTSDYDAPMMVTLMFVSGEASDVNAVFTLPPGAISSEDLTIGDGQVSFMLPRPDDGDTQISLNMALSGGELDNWEINPDRKVGNIQVEITPLDYGIASSSDAGYSIILSSDTDDMKIENHEIEILPGRQNGGIESGVPAEYGAVKETEIPDMETDSDLIDTGKQTEDKTEEEEDQQGEAQIQQEDN